MADLAALTEAVKSGELAEVKKVAIDLVEQKQAEVEEANRKREATERQHKQALAAKDAVIQRQADRQRDTDDELAQLRTLTSGEPSEREKAQLDQVQAAKDAAQVAVRHLVVVCASVKDSPESEASGVSAGHAVDFICTLLAELLNEAGFDVDLQDLVQPDWSAPDRSAGPGN